MLNYQIETDDREMVAVDQQLLDKTGNRQGIEHTIHHKTFANINFVNFVNRSHSQIIWSGITFVA